MKSIVKFPIQEFSADFFATLKTAILAAKQSLQPPYYAAFDADGTLWNIDMGEAFFEYQIDHCGLKNLPEDPEGHYLQMKDQGRYEEAYLWLAQINQSHPLSQVRAWAQAFLAQLPEFPCFESQKQLIRFLQEQGIEVFVVTASIKWSVEPGAALLGIDADHVLGVKTQLLPGPHGEQWVGEQADGPITYKAGKVKALMEATQGVAPIFSAGNTTGDTQLLEASRGVRLAVGSQPPGSDLFSSEEELRCMALEKQWFSHSFWNPEG